MEHQPPPGPPIELFYSAQPKRTHDDNAAKTHPLRMEPTGCSIKKHPLHIFIISHSNVDQF